jgi:hypothetical protein
MNFFIESTLNLSTLSVHTTSSFNSTYHHHLDLMTWWIVSINDSLTNQWSFHWSFHQRFYLMTFYDYVMNRLFNMWAKYSACWRGVVSDCGAGIVGRRPVKRDSWSGSKGGIGKTTKRNNPALNLRQAE